MTSFRIGLLAVAVFACGAAFAADPDPQGEPTKMEGGKVQSWYVWHDKDGWHVRTTTKKMEHQFSGTVRVTGGQFKEVTASKLEQNKAVKDWWVLEDKDRTLKFDFKTNGAMDGIDFTLGGKADDITFTLKIDGEDKTERIFIGKDSAHPKSNTFVMPAHPNKK